jgi:hypothetical protein
VFLTLEQIGGVRTTTADLMTDLVKLRRSDVIRWIAAISASLERCPSAPECQRELATVLLTDDLIAGLDRWLKEGERWNWTIFHTRQLRFLLQMTVLACKEDTTACDDATFAKAMGRLCLMVNDLLHVVEPQQDSEEWKTNYDYCFVPSILALIEHGSQMEVLARAHQFWFQLPATSSIVERFRERSAPAIAEAFDAKYGLSLERFYLIALSLWSGFQSHAAKNSAPLLLNGDEYLVPHFGKDDTDRAMTILSQSPDQLACSVFCTPRQNWSADCSLLKAKPIIEVFPGKYACPDLGILHRYLTEGIYFLLQDIYPAEQFRELFGYAFEAYIHDVISEFGVKSDILTRTFWPSPKFVGTSDQAGDALLHDRDFAVLMEFKARLLTTRERYAGIPEVTWTGIDDIVARQKSGGKKGVFQLASNIRRLLSGEAVFSGRSEFRLSDTAAITPALVTYEDAIGLGAVRKRADRKLRDTLSTAGADLARIGPLLILTIHDIEVLEAFAHKNRWVDVLRGYAAYVQEHPGDPLATFGIFLSKSSFHSEDPGTSFVAKAFSAAITFAEENLPGVICPASPSTA